MITFQLEARFTKQQIFEMYANQINLGQRGSFAINGFGEASQSFFGKPMGQLDLAQCATIAGLIQNPNRRNPYRHPDRAIERRNVVLQSMADTGDISDAQAATAKAEPLRLAPPTSTPAKLPTSSTSSTSSSSSASAKTSPASPSASTPRSTPSFSASHQPPVEAGMRNVDEQVRRLHGTRKGQPATGPITYPQVSLVALNPHTGQILALVGGRNYGTSQLNHALSQRPTGSIFKPFVYATAFNSSLKRHVPW